MIPYWEALCFPNHSPEKSEWMGHGAMDVPKKQRVDQRQNGQTGLSDP
jgi:hypothetical protein